MNFPGDSLMDALQIVMDNYVFEFGNEHFKQCMGTAMGTPVACIYATLYYRSRKGKLLLKKYEKDILFLRRFIDDMFGIWICTSEQFESFKNDFPFGKLLWDATALGKSVNFLVLTITIEDDGTISTKTYQKAMNLHLYTPAIKGVINSFIH